MIITIKIDAGKSIELFRQLLYDDDVEIIEIRSDPKPLIITSPYIRGESPIHVFIDDRIELLTPDEVRKKSISDILLSMEDRTSPLLLDFKNRCEVLNRVYDVPEQICLDNFEDIFHYPGDKSSWFIRLLSLTCRKARFRYLVAILIWMSRLLTFVVKGPFIKTLFYRKCFMVLKDFGNIRRCYQF